MKLHSRVPLGTHNPEGKSSTSAFQIKKTKRVHLRASNSRAEANSTWDPPPHPAHADPGGDRTGLAPSALDYTEPRASPALSDRPRVCWLLCAEGWGPGRMTPETPCS